MWLIIAGLCFLALLCHWPQRTSAQGQLVHVVQLGESLSNIALRYGTTVEAIAAANSLADPDQIQEGQKLTIPAGSGSMSAGAAATGGGTYVVQAGDTLLTIAWRYGLKISDLRQVNGLFGTHLLNEGQSLLLPGAGGTVPRPGPTKDTYIAQFGDTLDSIAEDYSVGPFALAWANAVTAFPDLRLGQLLRVRGPGLTPVKRIVVDISEQHLWAYEDRDVAYSFICSSGRAPYYTKYGEFAVQSKIPNAYGSTWDIWMPHWMGIYWAGGTENGIHALPINPDGSTLWAGFLGRPVSFGCIVLDTYDAKTLYDWAEMGTPVIVQP
jgi:LysM repeat protein